jgi:hypothetical protein
MRRSLWLTWGLGLFIALLAPGCNKGDDDDDSGNPGGGSSLTPSQLCSNVALDQCDKIYSCASAEQLRSLGFPNSKLDCGSRAIQQLGCTSASQNKICAGSANVTAADASACSNQVKGASCSDAASKQVSSYAPQCGQCALKP